jgi:hypothetical protein
LVTVRETGSIRDTTPAASLATQTAPLPAAIASAPAATGIGALVFPVSGSILTTVLSAEFATHTAPTP